MRLFWTFVLGFVLLASGVLAEGSMDGTGDLATEGISLAYVANEPLLREPVVIFKAPEIIVTTLGPDPLAYGEHWELRLQQIDPVYDAAFSGSFN